MKWANEKYLKGNTCDGSKDKWVVCVASVQPLPEYGGEEISRCTPKISANFCSYKGAVLLNPLVLFNHLSYAYQLPIYSLYLEKLDYITIYLDTQDKAGFASQLFFFLK